MAITAEQFAEATGRQPENDDLERCNCDKAGLSVLHSFQPPFSRYHKPRLENGTCRSKRKYGWMMVPPFIDMACSSSDGLDGVS